MHTRAIVLKEPYDIAPATVSLTDPGPDDVVVETRWTGVSSGTEKLLWNGAMPKFPGMGYPLVPGYEAVGEIVEVGARSERAVGETVFVPGARCYQDARGLFGASAARLIAPGPRTHRIPAALGAEGVLLALAATAHHALALPNAVAPDLVIGAGPLGRLLVRIAAARGDAAPALWEVAPERMDGAIRAEDDPRKDYAAIIDASGDPAILDLAIQRLRKGGALTLAGFYAAPLSFSFAPAFMREATIRIAAEFGPEDVAAVLRLVEEGALSLGGLITHRAAPEDAAEAYRTAFEDPACMKMTFDWRTTQ